MGKTLRSVPGKETQVKVHGGALGNSACEVWKDAGGTEGDVDMRGVAAESSAGGGRSGAGRPSEWP